MTALWRHAAALIALTAIVMAWHGLAVHLPALDALLAPSSDKWLGAMASAATVLGRIVGVVVISGLVGTILVDAVWVATREGRAPPTG